MNASEGSPIRTSAEAGRARALLVLLAVQALAALFFLIDIAGDLGHWDLLSGTVGHNAVEVLAVAALVVAILLGTIEVQRMMARQRHVERQLRAASGAFFEILQEHFDAWGLTPAERDVALLAIRGLSTAEIAAARATRTGTVKAQSAAVYAKAGVSSRQQLLSLFIDELMANRLGPPPAAAAVDARAPKPALASGREAAGDGQ